LTEPLKNFDENHLAKILFTSSSRSMRADHFRDKRIETAHQLASRFIIVAKRARNQRICVTIIHVVVEAVSTLIVKTAVGAFRLRIKAPNPNLQIPGKLQSSSSKNWPRGDWLLELGISLELGAWDLEFPRRREP
jgi:hypothetical protein